MLNYIMFAQAPAQQSAPPGAMIVQMFPFLLIFGIFYFLLIRPQQKKQKEHKAMLGNIKKGDAVLTNGGIYGVIAGVKDKAFTLKIADNVKIEIARNSISAVIKKKDDSSDSS